VRHVFLLAGATVLARQLRERRCRIRNDLRAYVLQVGRRSLVPQVAALADLPAFTCVDDHNHSGVTLDEALSVPFLRRHVRGPVARQRDLGAQAIDHSHQYGSLGMVQREFADLFRQVVEHGLSRSGLEPHRHGGASPYTRPYTHISRHGIH
jgi:hypothetical protein